MPSVGAPAGFRLVAPYEAMGDQPRAIAQLNAEVAADKKAMTLLGVTGSG